MMRTRYDRENGDFSARAHRQAEKKLYPHIFSTLYGIGDGGADGYEIEYHGSDEGDSIDSLDVEHGIDTTVKFECGFRCPIPIYVQERFRRPTYQGWQDIVLTEWNKASGEPSELGKIKADHFIYGYYDEEGGEIVEAIVADVEGIKRALVLGDIQYDNTRENPKGQTMVCIPFSELRQCSIPMLHYQDGELCYNGYGVEDGSEIEHSAISKKEGQAVFVIEGDSS